MMALTEGYIDFKHPSIAYPCSIWYKISGTWPVAGLSRPLLTLHGGPGYTHDYMLPLELLCESPSNLTVIFFDQLGSGKSTHFREKLFDYGFWSEQFFLDQVTTVIEYLNIQNNYDLLGHSWGGMLATIHAARQPQGLNRLVLAHCPVASEHWLENYHKFRELMPEPHRTILKETRTVDSSSDPKYLDALKEFYRRHFINVDPVPAQLAKSWEEIEADRTASWSALGPDEFDMTGSLAAFTAVDDVQNITAKTLVVTGVNEGCDHEESIRIFKQIPDSTHVRFENSTHFAHFEEQSEFMDVVAKFLGY
ncbi:hypothetical protein ZTR_09168 [Talaromyces verruculosus]|nr:hypothetical protein ZTR_09168 [Talaromyces verruculosus]